MLGWWEKFSEAAGTCVTDVTTWEHSLATCSEVEHTPCLDTKQYKVYDFTYMTFAEEGTKLISANRHQISGGVGQEVGDGNVH